MDAGSFPGILTNEPESRSKVAKGFQVERPSFYRMMSLDCIHLYSQETYPPDKAGRRARVGQVSCGRY